MDTWLTAQGADVHLLAMSICLGPRPPTWGHGHCLGLRPPAWGHDHGHRPGHCPTETSTPVKCQTRVSVKAAASSHVWQKQSEAAPGFQDAVSGLLVETKH